MTLTNLSLQNLIHAKAVTFHELSLFSLSVLSALKINVLEIICPVILDITLLHSYSIRIASEHFLGSKNQ